MGLQGPRARSNGFPRSAISCPRRRGLRLEHVPPRPCRAPRGAEFDLPFLTRELSLEGSQGKPRWTVKGQEVREPLLLPAAPGEGPASPVGMKTPARTGLSDLALVERETQDKAQKTDLREAID